jgi:hypothetical protein
MYCKKSTIAMAVILPVRMLSAPALLHCLNAIAPKMAFI